MPNARYLVIAALCAAMAPALAAPPKVVRTLKGHTDRVNDAQISADNDHVATASSDKTVRLWDGTGATVHTFTNAQAARFSPDGSVLAVASGVGIELWDVKANASLRTIIGGGERLWFSADGSQIGAMSYLSSFGPRLAVWDVATGKKQFQLVQALTLLPDSELFSPDGKRVIVVLASEAQLLDATDGKVVQKLARKQAYDTYPMPQILTKFAAGGGIVFNYEANAGSIHAWSTDSAEVLMAAEISVTIGNKKAGSYEMYARGAAFDPSGGFLLSYVGATGRTLSTVYNLAKSAKAFSLAGQPDVTHAVYNAAGTRIATCNFANKLMLWDAAKGKLLGSLTAHGDIIPTLAFSHDGTRLVTASYDKTAKVWDVPAN